MDKRFIPFTTKEQLLKRQYVTDTIQENPDWNISKISQFIRSELRLTVLEMAKLCKIAPQTLQKIEQEEHANPTLQTVEKILRPFGFRIQVVRIDKRND